MKKIISLGNTQISPLILLSSRIVITNKDIASLDAPGPFDLNYRFETILNSQDFRFLSQTYTWCSTFAYFSSFRLFHFTLWMHHRIAGKIRCRLRHYKHLELKALANVSAAKPS